MRVPERIVGFAKRSYAVSQPILAEALTPVPVKLFDECRKRGLHIRRNGRFESVHLPRCVSIKDFDGFGVIGLSYKV
jgi:hypothetical protein